LSVVTHEHNYLVYTKFALVYHIKVEASAIKGVRENIKR